MVVVVWMIAWGYFLCPRWLQRVWICGLASVFKSLHWREKVIRENLKIIFPQWSEEQVRDLVQKSYRHFASLVFEMLLFAGPARRWIAANVSITGVENWQRAHDRGQGVLVLCSHLGNWEITAGAGGLMTPMEILIVTKKVKPAWLHRMMERGRARCLYGATYEPRTMKEILKQLGQGKTVGFVLDQYTGPPVGIRVPFGGVHVGTHSVVATIARKTGALVVPVTCIRDLYTGKMKIEISEPLEWESSSNPHREIAHNTARYAAVMEAHVRRNPEGWLWVHRRFKGELGPLAPGEWDQGRK